MRDFLKSLAAPLLVAALMAGYTEYRLRALAPPAVDPRKPDPVVLKLGADYRTRLDAAVADQLAGVAKLEFANEADLQAKFQAGASAARRQAWLPVADELTRRFGKTPDAGQFPAIREFYAALAAGFRGAK